jgi:hypothetical protein
LKLESETMIKKIIRNDRGSTTIFMVGLLLGIILLGFVFFDMTSVFMERRMSQTGSDAAVMAAAIQAEKAYKEEMEKEAEDIIKGLYDRTQAEKLAWEQSDREIPWSEVFAELIEDLEGEFDNRSMPSDIKNYLDDGNGQVDIDRAMRFLWDREEISDLVCEAVYENEDKMRDAAQEFADANGIENDISIVFPVEGEGFRVGVRTKSTINDSFIDSVQTDQLKVPAHGIVQIQEPKNVNINCR